MRKLVVGCSLVLPLVLFGPDEGALAQQFDPRRQDQFGQGGRPGRQLDARLRTYRFNEAINPRPLPRSHGAALCALTTVDDDSPDGFCKVYFDNDVGEWMQQTGGGPGDNACEATCLWIGPDADEDHPPPRWRRQGEPY